LCAVGQFAAGIERLFAQKLGSKPEAVLKFVRPLFPSIQWQAEYVSTFGADRAHFLAGFALLDIRLLAIIGIEQGDSLQKLSSLQAFEQWLLGNALLAGLHLAFAGAVPVIAQVVAFGSITGSDQLEHRELNAAGIDL